AVALQLVVHLRPDAKAPETLGSFDGAVHRNSVYCEQPVSRSNTGVVAGGVASHVERVDTLGIIEPGDTVIRRVENKALLEVDNAENDRSQGNGGQSHRPES